MKECEFRGRHTPPPGHDGYSTYNCAECGAEARPSIPSPADSVPRIATRPKPDGFAESVRFVVYNPDGLPLPPGSYLVELSEPHRITGIIPLTIVRNVTDDRR